MSNKKQFTYNYWKHKVLEEVMSDPAEEVVASQDDELNDAEELNDLDYLMSISYTPSHLKRKTKSSNIKVLPELKGLNADQIEFIIDELDTIDAMIPHKFTMNGTELILREKYALNINGRVFVYYPNEHRYEEIIAE